MRQVLIIVFAAFLTAPAWAQEVAAADAPDAAEVTEETPGPEVADPADPSSDAVEAPALAPIDAATVSLEDFLWVARPVVVFADTPADPRFQEQLDLLLARPEELLARDVVLLVDSDPKARSEVRLKLRPRGFMLTLIAKDGTVNLRKPFPWDVRELTRAIDKMPLRQEEIRKAKAEAAAAAEAEAE